ncbi:MAG: hypothetical protein IJJ01_09725 [Firmicutes bacterium]|nr:hypothetical protein [Bacillota bacterium]
MNLYWPVYKNLETEVLQLADSIHFCDGQLRVYSIHIADLIVRCAVEIEAISKDLYERLGGEMEPKDEDGNDRDLYFDTDCLQLINNTWKLDKKELTISCATMYFEKAENVKLIPLHKSHKRGDKGSRWKRAYMALKHDRYGSLNKGTVENLLNALGSLYILNIYYADDSFDAGIIGYGALNFTSQYESKVFTPDGVGAYNLHFCREEADDTCIVWDKDDNLESAVYIGKYSDDDFKKRHFDWCVDQKWNRKRFDQSEDVKQYLIQHPEDRNKEIKDVCLAAGGKRLLNEIVIDTASTRQLYSKVQVKLNKDGKVYPTIPRYEDEVLEKEILKRWADAIDFKYKLTR